MGATSIVTPLDPRLGSDEVLAAIQQDMSTAGDGGYRVTITRQASPLAANVEDMAIFENVTYQQLVDFPIWLPELIDNGGGLFRLKVQREDKPGTIGGGYLQRNGVQNAPNKPFNESVIDHPSWRGPRQIVRRSRTTPDIPIPTIGQFPTPGVSAGDPSHGNTTRSPGVGSYQPPPIGAPLAETERYLARREQEIAEMRHQQSLAQLRAEMGLRQQQTDQLLSSIREDMRMARHAPPAVHSVPQPPKEDSWSTEKIVGTITTIVGAAAALLKPVFDANQERAREERAANIRADESRRQDAERAAALQRKLFVKLSETGANTQAAVSAGNQVAATMISQMGQTMLSMTAGFKELTTGAPPEEPWAIAMKAFAEPIGKAAAAMMIANAPKNAPVNTNETAKQLGQELTGNQQPQQPQTGLDKILQLIANHAPVAETLVAIADAMQNNDPGLVQAAAVHGPDVEKIAIVHLGEAWFKEPKNAAYWTSLKAAISAAIGQAQTQTPAATQQAPASAQTVTVQATPAAAPSATVVHPAVAATVAVPTPAAPTPSVQVTPQTAPSVRVATPDEAEGAHDEQE